MTYPRGAATRRPAVGAAAAIALAGMAAAACSSGSPPAAGPAPTAPAASASPAAPVARTPRSASARTPTLGQAAGLFAHGRGFGQVKPSEIFNGGDPTGLVTHVVWATWGGPRAVATGVSDYVGPGQTVAGGRQEAVTIVAFNLGTCDGKLMYQAVEWYFPRHHQAFNPGRYENVCTGTYVPAA